MKAIINAELVMRDHLIPEAVLFVEDGKIAGFGEMRTTAIPEGCEIINAEGKYVAPSLQPCRLQPARLLCQRGGSPGKNTGVYWPILVAIPF